MQAWSNVNWKFFTYFHSLDLNSLPTNATKLCFVSIIASAIRRMWDDVMCAFFHECFSFFDEFIYFFLFQRYKQESKRVAKPSRFYKVITKKIFNRLCEKKTSLVCSSVWWSHLKTLQDFLFSNSDSIFLHCERKINLINFFQLFRARFA